MKILTVIGARPQFIKAAVISRLVQDDKSIEEVLVHTGQHYDENMSDIFFEEMDIPKPKYNLSIQSILHGEMTGRMITELEKVVMIEKPDWILVYGDTNSTLAAAIVASKLHIKLAHVEAGLRSFNNRMPEEINRIITDRVSDVLFCPTETAIDNLRLEGFSNIRDKTVIQSGDIMYDASKYYASRGANTAELPNEKFVLCTVHRAENTDDLVKLSIIFQSLDEIGKSIGKVVFALHPRTKKKIESIFSDYIQRFPNISFIPPLSYLEMISHLQTCQFVITDSGGLQKEAYFFEKMCLTLRDETEWIELVKVGCNILSAIERDEIVSNAQNIVSKHGDFSGALYGDGNAGKTIVKYLKEN